MPALVTLAFPGKELASFLDWANSGLAWNRQLSCNEAEALAVSSSIAALVASPYEEVARCRQGFLHLGLREPALLRRGSIRKVHGVLKPSGKTLDAGSPL